MSEFKKGIFAFVLLWLLLGAAMLGIHSAKAGSPPQGYGSSDISAMSGTLGTSNGGTGLTSVGAGYKSLRANSAGTALEYSYDHAFGTAASDAKLLWGSSTLQALRVDDGGYVAFKSGSLTSASNVTVAAAGDIRGDSYSAFTVTNPTIQWPNASPDVGLGRSAAGVLKVSDGSTGFGHLAADQHRAKFGSKAFDLADGTWRFQASDGTWANMLMGQATVIDGSSNPILGVLGSVGRFTMATGSTIVWSTSATDANSGVNDTGFARAAAGVVKVTNGSSGDGTLRVGDGSSGAPSYSFSSDSTIGLYVGAGPTLTLKGAPVVIESGVNGSGSGQSLQILGGDADGGASTTGGQVTIDGGAGSATGAPGALTLRAGQQVGGGPTANVVLDAQGGLIQAKSQITWGTGIGAVTSHVLGPSDQALRISSTGSNNVVISAPNNAGSVVTGVAALATDASDGFLYIPSCAGVPTGTPTSHTGVAPLVIDSTNNKLYAYIGGSWRAMN